LGCLDALRARSLGMVVLTRRILEVTGHAITQWAITLIFLAYNAAEMLHAIGLTLVRLLVTQRRLLEWETAASVASRAAGLVGRAGVRAFFAQMVSSPLIAVVAGIAILALRPECSRLAFPVLSLWVAAPALAF